jgi:hypothetical protein
MIEIGRVMLNGKPCCLATFWHSMSSSTLYPGFKQVTDFGPDDDYEDEEISYVTLDLGSVEPALLPASTTYRLMVSDLKHA